MTYKPYHNQAGVTLLLAILIMAGLALITLAIGSFAIQELRASRAVVITEPAITAAETGAESGLWAVKRNASLPTCPTLSTERLGNNSLVNSCITYSSANVNLNPGTPYSFYLYDPNNINGDMDLSGYPYQYIDITYVSGSFQVAVSAQRLNASTTGLTPPTTTVNPGGTARISVSPVTSGSEGRIKVTLSTSGNVTVTISSDRGIPSIPTVDTLACNSRTQLSNCNQNNQESFSRRIQVTVPK